MLKIRITGKFDNDLKDLLNSEPELEVTIKQNYCKVFGYCFSHQSVSKATMESCIDALLDFVLDKSTSCPPYL